MVGGDAVVASPRLSAPAAASTAEVARTGSADAQRLARGGVLNLFGAAVAAVTNTALVIGVTRAATAEEAGLLFAATSAFLIAVSVAKLGTETGIVYYVARLRVLGGSARLRRCIQVATLPVLVTSLLLGAVIFLGADAVADLVTDRDEQLVGPFLRVLALFIPAAALSDVLLAGTRGFRAMRPTVVVDRIARQSSQLLLVLAVAFFGSVTWLAAAWALPYLPAVLASGWWLRRLLRQSGPAGHPPERAEPHFSGRAFWRFTAPRAVTSIVQLALQRLDILLLVALRGPVDAALYTAATRFLVVGQMATQAISSTVQPRLSELLALDDGEGAKATYRTSTIWLILSNWPIYLLAIAFATPMLALFGSGYTGHTDVIAVLAVAMLVSTGCGIVDVALNMSGRTTWTLANSSTALALNVALDLVLIPRLGILGAALGWAAAIVYNNLVPLTQLAVAMRLHPLGRGTALAAALAGGCFASPLLVQYVLRADSLPALALTAALATAVYAAACYRWRRELQLDQLPVLRRRRTPVRSSRGAA